MAKWISYCHKCKKYHKKGSKIAKAHAKSMDVWKFVH